MTKSKHITHCAIIAAIYFTVSVVAEMLFPQSGAIQVRVAEALCILALFTHSAIWGLFIGCCLTNWFTGCTLIDIAVGSSVTLLAAFLTYTVRNAKFKFLLGVSFPIIINSAVIPLVLLISFPQNTYLYMAFTVFIGEIISCGILGGILYTSVKKINIFKE